MTIGMFSLKRKRMKGGRIQVYKIRHVVDKMNKEKLFLLFSKILESKANPFFFDNLSFRFGICYH